MRYTRRYLTEFGAISVSRSKSGVVSYYQNGCFHSQADRQGVSICVYIHLIYEAIRQTGSRNVLIIGCAGGTLATMLRRLHYKVTIVDINPVAFTIARAHFGLPDNVRCVRRDGIAYLRSVGRRFDAIVIDVFGTDNTVPKPFRIRGFFVKIGRVLTPSGIMLMNLIATDDRDPTAGSVKREARRAGLALAQFDWPGQQNRNTLLAYNLPLRLRIPSGNEPAAVAPDFVGMQWRAACRQRVTNPGASRRRS